MPVSPHQLLEFVVETHDERDCPVTSATASDHLDTTTEVISNRFETLVGCELVRPVDDGYRPTVTGREFLALDIEDGPVVVDTDPE